MAIPAAAPALAAALAFAVAFALVVRPRVLAAAFAVAEVSAPEGPGLRRNFLLVSHPLDPASGGVKLSPVSAGGVAPTTGVPLAGCWLSSSVAGSPRWPDEARPPGTIIVISYARRPI